MCRSAICRDGLYPGDAYALAWRMVRADVCLYNGLIGNTNEQSAVGSFSNLCKTEKR